jgi:hypothetical protein
MWKLEGSTWVRSKIDSIFFLLSEECLLDLRFDANASILVLMSHKFDANASNLVLMPKKSVVEVTTILFFLKSCFT